MSSTSNHEDSEATSNIMEAPEEVLSTMRQDGSRRWLYPTLSQGRFLTARRGVAYLLIALFFLLPVVHINGEPAMFLDIVHRRFALFGGVFYATDTALLMLLGLTLVLGVAWFTALFGRVWCGWGCPQTVYLEFVFRPIERLLEGKASQRKRRDEKEMTFDTAWRKVVKWGLYVLIAAAMAHTFVAYFVSWDKLLEWMTGPPAEHWGFFVLMALTTALIVFDFGYFREQMCTITCPYARLQSVLMDRDSLIVSYDPGRGEPRGRRDRTQREQEKQGLAIDLGDCIDCGACVRTCPTGIDIRDGLQLECISCTQCVDACDRIMDSLNKPPGLIRYTSENALEDEETSIVRPRMILYTVLLAVLSGLLIFGISRTDGYEVSLVRASGAPFATLPDGQISNRVKLRMQNRTGQARTMDVEILEPEGASVRIVGPQKIELAPSQMKRFDVWILVPRQAFEQGRSRAKLRIGDGTEDLDRVVTFPLIGPSAGGAAAPKEID